MLPPPLAATRLRVPVLTTLHELSDAVRQRLRTRSCPAGALFRAQQLELVDVPLPPSSSESAAAAWELSAEQLDALVNARVVLGDADVCAPLLLLPPPAISSSASPAAPLLRDVEWVQATFAGVEPFQRLVPAASAAATTAPAFSLTRAGGVMGAAMAQYVLGWIVAVERQFFAAREFQARREWASAQLAYRPFDELTVGVLGLGDIGQSVGRLLKAAGFRVLGFKRRVSAVEAAGPLADAAHRVTSDLQHVLEQSDVLVNVLPSTAATRGLLHDGNLPLCARRQPLLVNVGRGDVVSEAALLTALDRRWLSRAVLDVAAQEPLPVDSALWTHPRVHITPHVAAKSWPGDVADVFVDNLNRFLARQPLRFRVNWLTGY
ncbi:hypothetical protein P43SY_003237 [Pythium insidiosum]|uniref:D-isomer specific 2-hydroxyacid dehydrogenase NAD-binding domain-containing protein n=1 Tax=Pythium insidiosum TaxID=114742 RepID=A0AAD5M532_PYTIN|nr:hypothetical protein P43SY_003237 [Pythium insidiosum]KAJ0397804.1 hypothetical protein ATCC90586_010215 [Pythium insidiosum]